MLERAWQGGTVVSRLTLRILDSVAALRDAAPLWNDLWQRSDSELPTARAELLAQWIEHFAPRRRVAALAVADGPRWVAALPLVGGRLGQCVAAVKLPGNRWTPGGDLLLDPVCDQPAILDRLVAGLAELRWPLLWLEGVRVQSHRWQMLSAALQRAGLRWSVQPWWHVGQVEIAHDWPAYTASRSRNLRRYIERCQARAVAAGGVELEIVRPGPSEVAPLLRRGFEVENRGWKGAAGTSVLRHPDVLDFFVRQAESLARAGELELVFLHHQGRPIAFEYGWTARGAYCSLKVGYDEAYGHLSPGQLLRCHHLEQMHGDPTRRLVDYLGPIVDATARWSTQTYTVGRLAIATRRPTSRLWWNFFVNWRPRAKKLLWRASPAPMPPHVNPLGLPAEPAATR